MLPCPEPHAHWDLRSVRRLDSHTIKDLVVDAVLLEALNHLRMKTVKRDELAAFGGTSSRLCPIAHSPPSWARAERRSHQ